MKRMLDGPASILLISAVLALFTPVIQAQTGLTGKEKPQTGQQPPVVMRTYEGPEVTVRHSGLILKVAGEKGGVHLIDEASGVVLMDTMQFRKRDAHEKIKTYNLAYVPVEAKVISETAIELVYDEPEIRILARLLDSPAEGTVPAGTTLEFRRKGRWPAGLDLTVAGGPLKGYDIFSARIRKDEASRITCVGAGKVRDRNADSLYCPKLDLALHFTTRNLLAPIRMDMTLDPAGARFTVIRDLYRKGRSLPFFKAMDVPTRPPAGWCSWYYYYLNITEEEMLKNTAWLAKHLKPYGCETVQLDDGFQLLAPDGHQAQSWTTWNDKFPNGPKGLADKIREAGFRAGLWLTPFSQGDAALVEANPEWFLFSDQGVPVTTFKGSMTLDATNDGALEGWFKPLFRQLAERDGYDYFKIDGQTTVIAEYRKHAKRFHEVMDPAAAYRQGLHAIREAIGPDRYLLNCWGCVPEGIGYVTGARTGGDIVASWSGMMPAVSATRYWYFTHNICWHADPDVICVRPPLTLEQARVWASLMGLTGQLLMASDKMYELPEERVEVLRRIYPPMTLRPMELYRLGERQLEILDTKIWKPFRSWDVVALTNFERRAKTVTVTLDALGVPKDWTYGVYDYWNDAFLGMVPDGIGVALPERSGRVLGLSQAFNDRPTLLATRRHITMGGVDLEAHLWDSKHRMIHGKSIALVPGEPYTVVYFLPETAPRVLEAFAEGAEAAIAHDGPVARVTFTPETATELIWRVRFAGPKAEGDTEGAEWAGREAARIRLDGKPEVTPRSVAFTWVREGGVPAGYDVFRNGESRGPVLTEAFADSGLEPETEYAYRISARPLPGQEPPSPGAVTFTVKTPAPPPPPPLPDVWLSDLTPRSATQAWGSLKKDRATEGNPLKIGGVTFEKGLGTHARSEIVFDLKPEYELFSAYVGVDQETGSGTVTFEVWLDGKKVYASPLVSNGDEPLPVTVPVRGTKTMRLVVTDGGDDKNYDHADWVRAGFVVRRK